MSFKVFLDTADRPFYNSESEFKNVQHGTLQAKISPIFSAGL